MKACTACGEIKPRDQFYTTTSRGRPYASARCKPCHNIHSRDRHRARSKDDTEYRNIRLLRGIKKRCDELSLPFDLDLEWVREKRAAGRCEVTGLPFDTEADAIHSRPWGFSIDRVIPELGYVKSNVKAVVWLYNRAKGCGTHEDVLRLAEALRG